MAKAATKAAVENTPAQAPAQAPAGVTVTIPITELTYGTGKVAIRDIPPVSLAYLLQYGIEKSRQDSVSGVQSAYTLLHEWVVGAKTLAEVAKSRKDDASDAVKQQALAERYTRLHNDACADMDMTAEESAGLTPSDFVRRLIATWENERLTKILAGDMAAGAARGPRATDPLEIEMRDVAEKIVSAAARKAELKPPIGKEMTRLRDEYLAKHNDKVRSIAQRNLTELAELDA